MKRLVCAVLAVASAAPLAAAQDADRAANRAKIQQLLEQASAAEQMNNAEEAESLLRAAIDVDSNDVAAVGALGRFLCDNDQSAEGLALLYRALELDPKNAEATIALVDALVADRDARFADGDSGNADASLARARTIIDRAKEKGVPPSDELELRRIQVLTRDDESAKEAFEAATKLVAKAPGNQEAQAALVAAATAAKSFDAALDFYAKSEMEPWLQCWFVAELRAARATLNYNHYEDDEQAVQDFLEADRQVLEAARLHPQVFDAASERASFYRSWAGWVRFTRQQRTEEAWDLFMSAYGRNPDNKNAIEGMSWACQRLYEAGELEKAREYSRQCCCVAPDRADFWNNYGLLCRDTGQYEESFRAYRRGMALAPDDARIINDCALILEYHLHRDLDQCERWLIRAEDLARARLADAQQNGDDAQVAEQRGVVGDALTNLARLYADQGRMEESAQEWNELRELDPARPELPENGQH